MSQDKPPADKPSDPRSKPPTDGKTLVGTAGARPTEGSGAHKRPVSPSQYSIHRTDKAGLQKLADDLGGHLDVGGMFVHSPLQLLELGRQVLKYETLRAGVLRHHPLGYLRHPKRQCLRRSGRWSQARRGASTVKMDKSDETRRSGS